MADACGDSREQDVSEAARRTEAERQARLLVVHAPQLKSLDVRASTPTFSSHLQHTFIELLMREQISTPEDVEKYRQMVESCELC